MQGKKKTKVRVCKNLLIKILQKKLREVDRIDVFHMIKDVLKCLSKDEEGDFEIS